MKKMLTISAIGLSVALSAQCNILGASSLQVNTIEKYSVETIAQCEECYNWSTSTDKLKFETNIKQKQVVLKAVAEGQNTILLSVMTPNGVEQCSKLIDIKTSLSSLNNIEDAVPKINCEISTTDFKDVMINEESISFVLNGASQTYMYGWNVTYANGEKRQSIEKTPQFPFVKGNDITSVQVKVQTTACYKELTRTYPLNYWSPPIEQRIPQRIYEHVSYSDYIKKN